ncbi:MAG: hypothetical protein AB8G17_10385 [Gammaproteobacteria bacterium]
MNWKRNLAAILLVPFSIVTIIALRDVGYMGIFNYELAATPGWQVLFDLVIAVGLICLWMISDARRNGRTVWPYLVIAVTAGSFGPLLYLLLTPSKDKRNIQAESATAT